MVLITLCLLALLASPGAAFAQGAQGSVQLVIMNPAVTLAAGSNTAEATSYTPIGMANCPTCRSTTLTITGGSNIIQANGNPGAPPGSLPLLVVTDNTGGNVIFPGPDRITYHDPTGTTWQSETWNLSAIAGLTLANAGTMLRFDSGFLQYQPAGGSWTNLVYMPDSTGVTVAGVLSAGNGAILP